jgi:hypothetical protein
VKVRVAVARSAAAAAMMSACRPFDAVGEGGDGEGAVLKVWSPSGVGVEDRGFASWRSFGYFPTTSARLRAALEKVVAGEAVEGSFASSYMRGESSPRGIDGLLVGLRGLSTVATPVFLRAVRGSEVGGGGRVRVTGGSVTALGPGWEGPLEEEDVAAAAFFKAAAALIILIASAVVLGFGCATVGVGFLEAEAVAPAVGCSEAAAPAPLPPEVGSGAVDAAASERIVQDDLWSVRRSRPSYSFSNSASSRRLQYGHSEKGVPRSCRGTSGLAMWCNVPLRWLRRRVSAEFFISLPSPGS